MTQKMPLSVSFVQDNNEKRSLSVILSVSEGSPRSDGSFFHPSTNTS
jgi:hypothetical protein